MTRYAAILLTLMMGTAPALAATPPANSYSQRLERLDPARRAAALRRAIVDSNQRCGRISNVAKAEPYKNLIGWTAHCDPGGDYVLFIGPDGSAQIRTCTDARMLNLPGCPPVKE
ncbi:MAG TPA: hypothetical protein VNZ43_00275 [Sphingomonadaceae bacterium]|nr:hypothetical protein [Sphingomonadaceae bacterium]